MEMTKVCTCGHLLMAPMPTGEPGDDSHDCEGCGRAWSTCLYPTGPATGSDDDQLVNGPYCAKHGRVGATIDGKCGQCYGVGRALDDRISELESQCEALAGALRFISGARYVVRTASGVFKATDVPFDDDELLLDLTEGPF